MTAHFSDPMLGDLSDALDNHLLIPRPGQVFSTGLLAVNEPNRIVVLVHGFLGNADVDGSWRGMFAAANEQRFAHTDIYFMGYEWWSSPIATSADLLYRELRAVASPDDPRAASYQQLVLAGHSLGGVVVRRMLVRHFNSQRPEAEPTNGLLTNVNVRLFAPAQGGASPSGVLGFAAVFGMKVVRGASRVVEELAPDSQVLRGIRDYCETNHHLPAMSAHTLWAGRERIVVSGVNYSCDPDGPIAHGETHTSVCKARPDYTAPQDLIDAGLDSLNL